MTSPSLCLILRKDWKRNDKRKKKDTSGSVCVYSACISDPSMCGDSAFIKYIGDGIL